MKISRLLAATVLAGMFAFAHLGCSSTPAKPPEAAVTARNDVPKATPEELTAPAGGLVFEQLRLLKDGELGLELDPGGVVDVPGRGIVGRIEHDGRFVDRHDKTLVQLTPKGELVLPNGDYLPVTMDDDGAVHLLKESRVVRLEKDGTLAGANPSGPVIRVEGVNDSTRRTAMFLLVLASYPILNRP